MDGLDPDPPLVPHMGPYKNKYFSSRVSKFSLVRADFRRFYVATDTWSLESVIDLSMFDKSIESFCDGFFFGLVGDTG